MKVVIRLTTVLVMLITVVTTSCIDLRTRALAFEKVAGSPVKFDQTSKVDPWSIYIPVHNNVKIVPKIVELHLALKVYRMADAEHDRAKRWSWTVALLLSVIVAFTVQSIRIVLIGQISLGLTLASILGSLHDGAMFGAVRKFILFVPTVRLPSDWRWPGGSNQVVPYIINLGDVAGVIGLGGIVTCLVILLSRLRRRNR